MDRFHAHLQIFNNYSSDHFEEEVFDFGTDGIWAHYSLILYDNFLLFPYTCSIVQSFPFCNKDFLSFK